MQNDVIIMNVRSPVRFNVRSNVRSDVIIINVRSPVRFYVRSNVISREISDVQRGEEGV